MKPLILTMWSLDYIKSSPLKGLIMKHPRAIKQLKWALLGLLTLSLLIACPKIAKAEASPQTETSSELTLAAAVAEALNRSPEIQRSRAVVEEKSWRKFESFGSGFLPKISISAQHYLDTQYTQTAINFGGAQLIFPGFYPNTQASLDVTMPLFNGLANVRSLQSASLIQDAASKELSRTEFATQEEVQIAFYQALAASELKAVAELNVKTLEDHLRQVKVQKQGGVATNYDSLRVEVQLNEARADAMDAEDNATLTRKKLTQLLGLENDERVLKGSLPIPDITPVKDLDFKDAPRDRQDIQALNLRSEAASKSESAASAWLVPSIFLGGQYLVYDSQTYNNVISNTGIYQTAYNVGVFLKWNLFDGGVAIAQAEEAASQTVQAEKTSQLAKLKIPYDFAYWKRRYLSNTDHYLSKKFDVSRSEESVRLAKEEERAGARTATETLDAELDLFRARAGVVNAQVNAAEAKSRLELALGRSLP
jgi:outer membrane protein TolC